MIETKMPKDILQYKTKLIGPLTARNIICLVIIFIVDFFLYQTIVKPFDLSMETLIYGFLFLDIPIAAFVIEPMGMPMEKYIKNVLIRSLLAPVFRKQSTIIYKTKIKINTKQKKKKDKNQTEKLPYFL